MTCQTAAERLSVALDGPAPSRFWVGVHLALCRDCRRFRRHLRVLDAVSGAALGSPPPDGEGLSAAARGRIAAALNAAPPR